MRRSHYLRSSGLCLSFFKEFCWIDWRSSTLLDSRFSCHELGQDISAEQVGWEHLAGLNVFDLAIFYLNANFVTFR